MFGLRRIPEDYSRFRQTLALSGLLMNLQSFFFSRRETFGNREKLYRKSQGHVLISWEFLFMVVLFLFGQ